MSGLARTDGSGKQARQFGVLGHLRVVTGAGEPVLVSGPRVRVLLAVLLWRAGQPVPADELAELVWDGSPPAAAPTTMRSLVMRLRRVLGTEGGTLIAARAPGYEIRVGEGELDASRFETLTHVAGAAVRAGRWEEAARHATAALSLWRAAPLSDVSCQALRDRWVPSLEGLRVQALEWRIDADLRLGRHAELISELRELTARHSLREHFHAQLMLALARAGRQAEALEAYRDARQVLAGELGIEPGPELRELHERVLAGDSTLINSVPAALAGDPPGASAGWPVNGSSAAESAGTDQAAGLPAGVVPRQLPAVAAQFTGRSAELAALDTLLIGADGQEPGTVLIAAVGGTAGVGKTALAAYWAHRAARHFPDGQLYANLRGYDPGLPTAAADVLAGFLRALGVPGQDIPPEADERAARYRSLLAGKRILVVLDNAGTTDQVRPLLPGTPGSSVVVTSRDALAGLVAGDGATRVYLDVLAPDEAVALLRALIGSRAEADPDAAAVLAAQCCRLPLALRVAAELAVARPDVSLAELTRELADLRARVNLLTASGDPHTEIATVFSWSCQQLSARDLRMFRLLGLHPGPVFGPWAAAALTGMSVPQARQALGVLARADLIQRAGAGHYAMHDLLRGYALELDATTNGQAARHAALTCLFDLYLHASAAEMDSVFPAERHRRPRVQPAAVPVPPLVHPGQPP